jgi:hypothetical protein
MSKKKKPNQKMRAWIDARKRHHLSHAQVQMARELGMNPKKLGKKDERDREPWKMPAVLRVFGCGGEAPPMQAGDGRSGRMRREGR